MSKLVRTTRWPLAVSLVASLILAGMFPQMSVSAAGASRIAKTKQAPKGCCKVAQPRACCGTACCAAPVPRLPQPQLPGPSRDDRRSGNSCSLALVAANAATDHDKAAADWSHGPSSLASGASSTLQSTHVRLNA